MVADEIVKYDVATQASMQDEHVPQLNPEQRAIYDNVMAAVNRRAFFVDGLGGTSKTFLYSCLLKLCAHRVGSLLLWHRLALLHCCWTEAALHTHV